jgi:hypothetical protein
VVVDADAATCGAWRSGRSPGSGLGLPGCETVEVDEGREHPDRHPEEGAGRRPPVGPPPLGPARRDDRGHPMQSIWRIRWVLMGLSFLLSIALIASGAVFLGVLLAAIVGVRLTMMFMWQRRRRDLRRGRNWPGA